MKKKIAIVAVIAGLGIAGISQAAGGWGKRGANYYNCPMIENGQAVQVDPALQEKRDKFFTDTQEIRKSMVMKQAEKRAMLRGDNPDPQAVSKISGELFDLRTTMREKAEEAGLPGAFGPMGGRRGFGPGMNGPGPEMGMNQQGFVPGMTSRGFGPGMNGRGFEQGVAGRGYGQGKGRYGNGGRNMGYMGNPGYGQAPN